MSNWSVTEGSKIAAAVAAALTSLALVPSASAQSTSLVLEEVVVTAQRRTESLQDVPISVASISADTLSAQGIQSTRDIQFTVPTLVYNQASVFAQPFIRGIGSDITAPNADPSVATYVDGIFVANTTAVLQGLLGVERVEVLQGPQGTLYGRNAVGGAVSIYTLTPTQEFEGKLVTTLGNYDLKQMSGHVSGGVTDTLALGIYAAYSYRDTYLDQLNPNLPEPDYEEAQGIRIKGVWTPTDTFTLTASYEHQASKGFEGSAFRNIQPDALAYLMGAQPIIKKYTIDSDYPQIMEPRHDAFMARADWDIGWANLVSITGWRDMDGGTSINDLDGTSIGILNSYASPIASRQFSEEIQLQSLDGSTVDWLVGLYYYDERAQFDPQATLSPDGIMFGPDIIGAFNNSKVDLESYSIFGQVTFPLVVEDLRLTLGGRYTVDKKTFEAFSYFSGADLVEIPGSRITFPKDSERWNEFTPKVTIDYSFDNTMVYASYSRGFKSGAYNVASPATPGPVDPEFLDAYEVGFKSDLAGGRARLNAAAYYYEFEDIQVQRIDLAAGGATTLQNAAEVEAYGVEGSLTVQATDFLQLTLSAAWEEGEYTKFPDAATFLPPDPASPTFPANTPASVDVKGNTLQRTPEWVFTAGANYDYPLTNGGAILATANWYYNDGYYWEPTNRYRQSSYNRVNATLGYRFPGEGLTVTVFGRNLTDDHYLNSLLVLPVSVAVQDAEPRTYGVTLTMDF